VSYYTVSWMNNIHNICKEHDITLPGEVSIVASGMSKGELAQKVIGDKFSFDYALPQGMVEQYRDDNDYDIRVWFVMAYPKQAGVFGILFPLCEDALFALNDVHCQAEEAEQTEGPVEL